MERGVQKDWQMQMQTKRWGGCRGSKIDERDGDMETDTGRNIWMDGWTDGQTDRPRDGRTGR